MILREAIPPEFVGLEPHLCDSNGRIDEVLFTVFKIRQSDGLIACQRWRRNLARIASPGTAGRPLAIAHTVQQSVGVQT